MRRLVSTAILFLVLASTAFAATFAERFNQQFYFRYEGNFPDSLIADDNKANITAYYNGIVGVAFNERLPIPAKFQNLTWTIDSGPLPQGLTYNSVNFTVSGTPTTASTGTVVHLGGYNDSGVRVAKADVYFTIYLLDDSVKSQYVDLYGHVGKYLKYSITLPDGIVVDHWETVNQPPTGITYNGRFIQGTPSEAGQFPIFNIGYDYTGKMVFVYQGKILIETGPTFDLLADILQPLAYNPTRGCDYGYECAYWLYAELGKVHQSITPNNPMAVKYSYEIKNDGGLPNWTTINEPFNGNPLLYASARIFDYFSQSEIRLKAVDSDGTFGYSNWFKIGSLGPKEICAPLPGQTEIPINGDIFKPFQNGLGYKVQFGLASGGVVFSQNGGTLPPGLTFDTTKGIIEGVPTAVADEKGIYFTATTPNIANSTPVSCGPYHIKITNPSIFQVYETGQKDDYRVGEDLNVVFTALPEALVGGYYATLDPSSNLPDGVTLIDYHNGSWALKGKLDTIADGYFATIKIVNGDGRSGTFGVNFNVKDHLKIEPINDVTISRFKEYTSGTPIAALTVENYIGKPSVSFVPDLPEGLSLSADFKIIGATGVDLATYGPFVATLTDSTTATTGEKFESAPFPITVGPRTGYDKGTTAPELDFVVNKFSSQLAFSPNQEPLAQTLFPFSYKIDPQQLPDGLYFDLATGFIYGTPTAEQTLDGYVIKATENDKVSANPSEPLSSDRFTIKVNPPKPFGEQRLPGTLQTNVASTDQIPQKVVSIDPSALLTANASSIVGNLSDIEFTGYSPQTDGWSFDPTKGQITIYNTKATYNGDATISFIDKAGRPGTLKTKVHVYPFPTIENAPTSEVTIARYDDASNYNIVLQAGEGFYNGVSWDISPNSPSMLPHGLTLSKARSFTQIVGTPDDPTGTEKTVVIRATSLANGLYVDQPITIKIGDRTNVKLNVPATTPLITFYKSYLTNEIVRTSAFDPLPYLEGSRKLPLTWKAEDAPDWLDVISSSGQVKVVKPIPMLGKGSFTINVKDSDDPQVNLSQPIPFKVTLDGFILPTLAGKGSNTATIRVGETFQSQTFSFENVVVPLNDPVITPDTYVAKKSGDMFTGTFDTEGLQKWTLSVTDADERTLASKINYSYTVVPALEARGPFSISQDSKQYDKDHPIVIAFNGALNSIDKVFYTVTGLPGRIYYKYKDANTQIPTWSYFDDYGVQHDFPLPSGKTVDEFESELPLGHLTLDEETLVLTGVASQSGTFNVTLHAHDSHDQNGYLFDQPRVPHPKESDDSPVFTITVAPADDLTLSESATSESVHQYTSQPTLSVSLANGAYGVPITWTRKAGTLPPGVSDNRYGTLSFSGYPTSKGTYSGLVYEGVDAAGRKLTTDPLTITVTDRENLDLQPSAPNPRTLIVAQTETGQEITAIHTPFGQIIPAASWNVQGADKLPPGVTYKIYDGGVAFSGVPTELGTFTGITVTAKDSLGQTKTLSLEFDSIESPDQIVLNVYDITTKVGFPVSMRSPYAKGTISSSNTFSDVKYQSSDASIFGLYIDDKTGEITGNAPYTGNFTFFITVSDETTRYTTKPVHVTAMPVLRVLVPEQLTVTQGNNITESAASDYSLGTVTFAKKDGTWPNGVNVTSDGRIIGTVTADPGTYSGLTIEGTDSFDKRQDTQVSNVFSIVVNPSPAKPVISDISNNKLVFGTVGTAASFSPTVTNDQTGKTWNLPNTTYSINIDVSLYGLTFDGTTGVISGTPTASVALENVLLTVASSNNDKSTTQPFTFIIAPKDPIQFASTAASYVLHPNTTATIHLDLNNSVGNVVYTTGSTSLSNIKVNYQNADRLMQISSAVTGSGTLWVTAKDQADRTVSKQFTLTVATMSVSYPTTTIVQNSNITNISPAVATNVNGPMNYSFTGLPDGLTYDATTGALSGAATVSGTFNAVLTATDTFDGQTLQIPVAIKVLDQNASATKWRIAFVSNLQGSPQTNALNQMVFYDGLGVAQTPSSWSSSNLIEWQAPYLAGGTSQCLSAPNYLCNETTKATSFWIEYDYNQPVAIDHVKVTGYVSSYWDNIIARASSVQFYKSNDGTNWTLVPSTKTGGINLQFGNYYNNFNFQF